MTSWTRQDYDLLHSLVFRDGYPGYKPDVVELPNGDGKADVSKRYAHIATKYLQPRRRPSSHPANIPWEYLNRAFKSAQEVVSSLGCQVPIDLNACALRVLEYPPGAGSELHTDFDLFTITLFREPKENVRWSHAATATPSPRESYSIHIGELGEIFGLGPATPHWVEPSDQVQRSIVFFALPGHDVTLPGYELACEPESPRTVGDWLAERMARSRSYK